VATYAIRVQKALPSDPFLEKPQIYQHGMYFQCVLTITASVGGLQSHMSTGEKHKSCLCDRL
jgi:hypothetical protein